MKKRFAVLSAAAAVAALGAQAGPAQAADEVVCGFEAELSYEGGVNAYNREVRFSSRSGTANCAGRVGGATVIGTGPVRLEGSGGSKWSLDGTQGCAVGSGRGSIELGVQKFMPLFDTDPSESLSGAFAYRHGGPAWEATGTVQGPGSTSALAIAALEHSGDGDCIREPVRSSTLSGRIVVGGDAESAEAATSPLPCANHVAGTRKRDRLAGTAGSDMVSGFGGDDRISGDAGEDCLFGGRGDDRLSGGPGPDSIDCGSGEDIVGADTSDRIARNCETVRSR